VVVRVIILWEEDGPPVASVQGTVWVSVTTFVMEDLTTATVALTYFPAELINGEDTGAWEEGDTAALVGTAGCVELVYIFLQVGQGDVTVSSVG
jgi:hypothetical protein